MSLLLTILSLPERASHALACGDVHVERAWLSGGELDAARSAAAQLRTSGHAALAGGRRDLAVRDCSSLDLLDDAVSLPAALLNIVARVDDLRCSLAEHTGRKLVESAELQLLHYGSGGRYARHVDDGVCTAARPLRRSISLLLYLTPDDWQDADGGSLRIHGSGGHVDVTPTAGSLVLFDSATVPHEVCVTWRERTVIVGWLLEPRACRRAVGERVPRRDLARPVTGHNVQNGAQ